METLEFIIHPDGRVEEKVTGIKGVSCEDVTRQIEEKLGCVVSQEKTSDFFAQATTDVSVSSTSTQSVHSQW